MSTLGDQIVTGQLLTNADINNWIQEELHVKSNGGHMELSEQNRAIDTIIVMKKTKLKWTTNVCIQWALEYDKPTSALLEPRDSAVILKNSFLKNFKFLRKCLKCKYISVKTILILKITLKFWGAVIAKIQFLQQVWFLFSRENRASSVFEKIVYCPYIKKKISISRKITLFSNHFEKVVFLPYIRKYQHF